MKRIICLDIGEKRIGIALSDPLFITAQGVETYERKNTSADIEYLVNKAKTLGADVFLVGLPLNMNGSFGPQAEKIKSFAEKIKKASKMELKYFDERLTTKEAEKVLIAADLSRAKRRKVIDKMAAVVILQSYLDTISI
ncbi:MAG: Holliday junction resolvase RuvX [Eubacteriales bacterium]